jgi:hypothetical protein
MTRRLLASLLAIILTAPLTLSAHDASKHKGKPTMGEIASIADGKVSLKTEDGIKTVMVNDETEILDGEAKLDLSKLVVGDPVTVYGTTLAGGEIVAKEIMKGMASSDGMKMEGMKGHDHKKMEHKH